MKRILFVSPLDGLWAGSEWLWAETARHLARQGWPIGFATAWRKNHPLLEELRQAGAREFAPNLPRRWWRRWSDGADFAHRTCRDFRPDLVLLNQPAQQDGLAWQPALSEFGVPYALLNQLVIDSLALPEDLGERLAGFFSGARAVWFVSNRSRRMLESQLGIQLGSAGVARNPCRVPRNLPFSWPQGELTFAMPSRLDPDQKGQDLALEVFSQPLWRRRDFRLRLYGAGSAEKRLRRLKEQWGLERVTLEGFATDVAAIWRSNQVVLMPSRQEGLPIAMLEGMLMGRPVVGTAVGGIAEVVEDGVSGFIAAAPEAGCLADALERCWQRRGDLPEMGRRAQSAARTAAPPDAAGDFAAQLAKIA